MIKVVGYLARHAAVGAGVSAREHAEMLGPLIDSTARQIQALQEALKSLRREQRNYRAGADGEQHAAARVQQVLVDLGSTDWYLLADRRWPKTRHANLDLILVGPPGVILLDAKNWTQPRIERGSLWHGQENKDDDIEAALRAADDVAQVLSDVGLAPVAVRPFIILVRQPLNATDIRGVTVVGETGLQRELTRLGPRLSTAQIETLVAAVDERCPPASRAVLPSTTRIQAPAWSPQTTAAVPDPLVDTKEIWDAAIEAATREPIEAWMTWLHPAQAQLITRNYSGPARVRGAAGTGKTVVALHRARELAKRPDARVLVTSFVRTLPQVQEQLFRRLAPDLASHVEFVNLHRWAVHLLNRRTEPLKIARGSGSEAFEAAWAKLTPASPLRSSSLPKSYWKDEVQSVIKGRGIAELTAYLALVRVGRRAPLRDEQRRAVWELYLLYQQELANRDECDYNDVVLRALGSVKAQPLDRPYSAVIVDEVQDLTCIGVRLVHELVGDTSNGLFIVGDGQQSVYTGGFTLAEAGISIAGRAMVLNRNYRNAAEILDAAFEVVHADLFDDLEADPLPGVRAVTVDRFGGKVARAVTASAADEREQLVRALRAAVADGMRTGDMAVLVPDNRAASAWVSALACTGIRPVLLNNYDGTTTDAVKVGTYQRAKGLEFACVFLPGYDRAVNPRAAGETDEVFRERAELERRRLFVAMTRARDRLWLAAGR